MDFNYILDFVINFSVVVCGILVAFLIDRINDDKRKKKKIKRILEIVISNMKTDIKIIEKITTHLSKHEKLVKDMINGLLALDNLDDDEKEFVTSFTGSAWRLAIDKRGYYLLKDGSIDYELQNDRLLTDIIQTYDRAFEGLSVLDKLIDNHLERSYLSTMNRHKADDILASYQKKFLNDEKMTKESFFYDETFLKLQLKDKNYRLEVAMHYTLVYRAYYRQINNYKSEIKKIIKKIEAKSEHN